MPVAGRSGVACSARGRAAASAVLPRGVHAASRSRRDRLPEQGQGLWTAVHSGSRDAHHHCGRSQASRRRHRRHRRSAQLGSESPASSSRALYRAGRWHIAGWQALDCLQVRLLSSGSRALALVPAPVLAGPPSHHAGRELQFFTDLAALKDTDRFRAHLAPLRKTEWVVYAKPPFAGPKQVLAYLVRYTHRVAIANSRLLDLDETHVSFRWKDYRESRLHKSKVMRINVGEFMRRFLLHVLPNGFHRIRHYGLFANGHRADKLALCRSLLDLPATPTDRYNDDDNGPTASNDESPPCPCCGGRMKIIEIFDGPLSRPYHARKLDGL